MMNQVNLLTILLLFSLLIGMAASTTDRLPDEEQYLGKLDSGKLQFIAKAISDEALRQDLLWIAATAEFFTIQIEDQLTLQAFHIPSTSTTGQTFLYSAGFSESVLKYPRLFRDLHRLGHEIYAYDLRGQGFSQSLPLSDPRRMGHIFNNIHDEYVRDLDTFVNHISTNMTVKPKQPMVYLANSFSCMIGLLYASTHNQVFSQMILIAPFMNFPMSSYLGRMIKVSRHIIPTEILLHPFNDEDISAIPVTHDLRKKMAWKHFRDILPSIFYFRGLSLGWVAGTLRGADELTQAVKQVEASILLFQADGDIFVDNQVMSSLTASMEKAPIVKFIRFKNAFHELIHETDDIVSQIMEEIERFVLRPLPSNTHASASNSDLYASSIDIATDAENTSESPVKMAEGIPEKSSSDLVEELVEVEASVTGTAHD
jgi:lysophospholipase